MASYGSLELIIFAQVPDTTSPRVRRNRVPRWLTVASEWGKPQTGLSGMGIALRADPELSLG